MNLLSFELFEALFRSQYLGGKVDRHYEERVYDRLVKLEVVSLVTAADVEVEAASDVLKEATVFFSKALSFLADPDGKFLKTIEVKPGRFGRVKLGEYSVLYNGEEVFPVFKIMITEAKDGELKYDTARSIWIYTDGDELKTIIGKKQTKISASEFADDTLTHIRRFISKNMRSKDPRAVKFARNKQDELIAAGNLVGLDLEKYQLSDWTKNVALVEPSLILKFDASLPGKDQYVSFAKSIDPSIGETQADSAPVRMTGLVDGGELIRTKEKTEVTVTPNKSWWLTYNDKAGVWGAQPVLESKIAPAEKGNSLRIQVGLKWLHWLTPPIYNVKGAVEAGKFVPFNIKVDKGEEAMFARQNSDGSWTAKGGIVKSVSGPDTTHVNPYLSFEGESKILNFTKEEGDVIFVPFIPVVKESFAMSFRRWFALNG